MKLQNEMQKPLTVVHIIIMLHTAITAAVQVQLQQTATEKKHNQSKGKYKRTPLTTVMYSNLTSLIISDSF